MRIPLGNFGNRVPDQTQQVRIQGSDAVNQAASNLADRGMQISHAIVSEERRQDEALTKARAANSLLDYELSIKTASSTITNKLDDGSLSHDQADKAWNDALSKIEKPDMAGFDPVMMEGMTKGLKRAEFSGLTLVQGAAEKAKRGAMQMQVAGVMDTLGKQASLPDGNPGQLNQTLDAFDDVGRTAFGANWEKKKQDAKDANWKNHLDQQAFMVRNSLEGIDDMQKRLMEGDLSDKLDSDKRNGIMTRLEGYKTAIIQRQEATASRKDREYERMLKRAEAEYNAFMGMADKGALLDPDYIDRVLVNTADTPYQEAVRGVAKQARETGGLAFQPVSAQQAKLDEINAQIASTGITPELDRRRNQIEKILTASKTDAKTDGLLAGLERGVIQSLAPIDLTSPDAIAQTLGQRKVQAETVAAWAGHPISPLDSREAEQLRLVLDVLPAKQKSAAVATLSDSLGPELSGALAAQLDKQDKPLALAFALSGTKTSNGRYASELMLKGAGAIKDGAVMKDDKKVTGWRATISQELDGVFQNEALSDAAKNAAYYITAGIASEEGGTASSADITRAVSMAIGGSIIEYNGKRLPTNGAMEAEDFARRVKNVPASDLEKQAPDGKVRVGGVEMPVGDFHSALPGQELAYAGSGRYAVIVKGRPVTNTAGKPIIVRVQ